MNPNAPRKRRTTEAPPASTTKTRRAPSSRAPSSRAPSSRAPSSRAPSVGPSDGDAPPPTETIHVMDSTADGVEEVVDLTCEAAEASVVDLTSNDSVLLVDEGPQTMTHQAAHSYIVSSDEDEDSLPASTVTVTSTHTSRGAPGTISCPICLDSYSEITESGRLVVSTKCGHVFCSQCLRDALTSSHTCPTCRKRLTHRQYHPLYI